VGCTLRNLEGESLGVVTEILRIEANSQLVVQGEKGEFLVPLVSAICREISIERREILVELPEGLMDLNK
jgi:ribosomal 30S subunit maturation factor RimM